MATIHIFAEHETLDMHYSHTWHHMSYDTEPRIGQIYARCVWIKQNIFKIKWNILVIIAAEVAATAKPVPTNLNQAG